MDRYTCRGKSVDTQEWICGNVVFYADFAQIWVKTDDGTWNYIVDPETVGQCTGLKDKNGIFIFDGDIYKDSLGRIAVVEWDNDNASFISYTTDEWDVKTGKYVRGERRIAYVGREPAVEIIGNIHNNPELLEVKA